MTSFPCRLVAAFGSPLPPDAVFGCGAEDSHASLRFFFLSPLKEAIASPSGLQVLSTVDDMRRSSSVHWRRIDPDWACSISLCDRGASDRGPFDAWVGGRERAREEGRNTAAEQRERKNKQKHKRVQSRTNAAPIQSAALGKRMLAEVRENARFQHPASPHLLRREFSHKTALNLRPLVAPSRSTFLRLQQRIRSLMRCCERCGRIPSPLRVDSHCS